MRSTGVLDNFVDKIPKLRIAQRLCREIECKAETRAPLQRSAKLGECSLDYPPIQLRGSAKPLGGRDEFFGRNILTGSVRQPREYFHVPGLFERSVQKADFLPVQAHPPIAQGVECVGSQSRGVEGHCRQRRIRREDHNLISAASFGRIAGVVCTCQRIRHGGARILHKGQSYARR